MNVRGSLAKSDRNRRELAQGQQSLNRCRWRYFDKQETRLTLGPERGIMAVINNVAMIITMAVVPLCLAIAKIHRSATRPHSGGSWPTCSVRTAGSSSKSLARKMLRLTFSCRGTERN